MAEAAIDPAYEVAMALTDYDSLDALKRERARERIRRLGGAAVEPLVQHKNLEALAAKKAAFRSQFPAKPTGPTLIVLSGILTMISLVLAGVGGSLFWPFITGACFVFFIFASVFRDDESSQHLRKASPQELPHKGMAECAIAALDSLECMAELAENLPLDDNGRVELEPMNPFAIALAHIVPKAGAEDVRALSELQRRKLFCILDMFNALAHAELVAEVIELAVRCGLTEYSQRIELLAGSGVSREGSLRVRSIARGAVIRLRDLEAKNRDSERLLRASTSPLDASSILLRPAGNVEEKGTTLMRPAQNPQGI